MPDLITTILDALGLLAVAAGVGAGLAHWIGWWGLAVAGLIVLAGSLLAHARTQPKPPAPAGDVS